ncbi:MAG TPA: hypothetical protein V6D43_08790 [Candidatus Sericytochromatia bacterium]|nr:hypothetical protein [Cyanobacteriota bacterium]
MTQLSDDLKTVVRQVWKIAHECEEEGKSLCDRLLATENSLSFFKKLCNLKNG